MELKQIKELMAAMERAQIKNLEIEQSGFRIKLERESESAAIYTPRAPSLETLEAHKTEALLAHLKTLSSASSIAPLVQEKVKETSPIAGHAEEEAPGVFITSPMVGTFYSAPSPDDPPYVKAGQKIEKGTVVCVIEAMKVMNEVKSALGGVVLDVLVENGQPIEFGTKLFRLSAV